MLNILNFLISKFKINKNIIKNNGINNHVYLVDKFTKEKCEIFESVEGIYIEIDGNNNVIKITKPLGESRNSKIMLYRTNNSEIEIDEKVHLINSAIRLYRGEGQQVIIGKHTSTSTGCEFFVHNNSSLFIGNDCMFSQNVKIWCSDGHSLIDKQTKEIINIPQKIIIGNHCWIGYDAVILKNVNIDSNSIIGAKSVVVKDTTPGVWAGNPAKLIKENVDWLRDTPNEYLKNNTKENF